MLRAGETNISDLKAISILIVGSPTQGFRPTKSVQAFIENIPGNAINDVPVAAFDTRIPENDVGKGFQLILKVGGYAAPRIASALKKKGGSLIAPPEGFLVKDKEGPLKEGELERAERWGSELQKLVVKGH